MSELINTELKPRKKSYQAKKNEGNNLFFMILDNILTKKSNTVYLSHLDNPTFDDVYTNVGVEKVISKCFDKRIVLAASRIQTEYANITDKKTHYWYLMNKLPKTTSGIDWRIDG